jgi:hypothetical protein
LLDKDTAMKWTKALLLGTLALGAASTSHAAGVGLRAGTTGIGGDVAFSLMPTLSARLGYSGLSYSHSVDVTDVNYDGKLRLSNLNALLDFSPLPGPFRVTGGFIFNDNKVDVTGKSSNGTYTLNGTVYPAAAVGSLTGTVNAGNRAAPYLGIALRGVVHDPMLESYVWEAHKAHTLESLAFRHLGRTALTYEDVCGKGVNQIPFAQVEIGRAAEYSARTPTWRCTSTRRSGRSSKERPGSPMSTVGSRCRPRRCSRVSSAPAC